MDKKSIILLLIDVIYNVLILIVWGLLAVHFDNLWIVLFSLFFFVDMEYKEDK